MAGPRPAAAALVSPGVLDRAGSPRTPRAPPARTAAEYRAQAPTAALDTASAAPAPAAAQPGPAAEPASPARAARPVDSAPARCASSAAPSAWPLARAPTATPHGSRRSQPASPTNVGAPRTGGQAAPPTSETRSAAGGLVAPHAAPSQPSSMRAKRGRVGHGQAAAAAAGRGGSRRLASRTARSKAHSSTCTAPRPFTSERRRAPLWRHARHDAGHRAGSPAASTRSS
jgi:hypothetical protein